MVNTEQLEKLIKSRGIKKGKIAETLGISYTSLKRKINNKTEFQAGEILLICNLLKITDLREKEHIFFANNVG